jgi:hypothetical protein
LNTLLITPVASRECELLEGLGRKQFAKSANVAPHRTILHPSFDPTTVLASAGICGLKKIFTEAS